MDNNINKLNINVKKMSKNVKNKRKTINYRNFLNKHKKKDADKIVEEEIAKNNKDIFKKIKKSYTLKKHMKQNKTKHKPNILLIKEDDKITKPEIKSSNIKKIIVHENLQEPTIKLSKKSKKKSKKKRSKNIIVDLNMDSNTKKVNNIDISNRDMLIELEKKGIILKNKSSKLIKDIYSCITSDNINIKNE